MMYSCDSFTGLLAAQTLPHHLIVQYEKGLSNILLPASLSGAARCYCGVNTIGTPPSERRGHMSAQTEPMPIRKVVLNHFLFCLLHCFPFEE